VKVPTFALLGLCFRCEHRARFLEDRSGEPPRPRYQCGETTRAVCSCYMYEPVAPLILVADPTSYGRMQPTGIAKGEVVEHRAYKRKKAIVRIFEPKLPEPLSRTHR
jgi:hypothetical protein